MSEAALIWLRELSWREAAAFSFVENVVVFALALVAGHVIVARFRHRELGKAPPLTRTEVVVALSSVVINSGVTLAGLALWRIGIVQFRTDVGVHAWLDVIVLILVMDFAMYALHRIAHVRWIFPHLHALHHCYEHVRPLTLFVLNPAEAISFGALWLVVISFYSASWLGMSVYLALNVAFGTLGHLGVEPLPSRWVNWPIARHIGTTTFHAQHHLSRDTNFGFYTLIWDRLFDTLEPGYDAHFGRTGAITPTEARETER
ncbi:Sterol desaturase family protein [Labilithrix luteola]|uniref:Sterol desaturase family protein n=1 Tax=Labilithrix luteola TaxID=1391654 RepID=A0A0K1Q5Y6_9BACT|nr:sterol desaturase family protein [Labilithrix luteola]AKV01221.1 Sterol desaturase family protein [Labilithrix luteola]